MAFYLGIDGGGTKTTCWLGDESSVLGVGTAGASNIVRVGRERASKSIRESISAACNSSRVSPSEIRQACAGFAGAARPEVALVAREIVAQLLPCPAEIVGDNVIALDAAFFDGPGVIVISGTGSIAYGRNDRQETARTGGWGHTISDEGSAQWIGKTAVAAMLRALDDGREDPFGGAILETLGCDSFDNLIVTINDSPQPKFADLFPVLASAAETRNPDAIKILLEAGGALAGLAASVINRLFPVEQDVPVAMTGSVFKHSAIVRESFYNSLLVAVPRATLSSVLVEPVSGALSRARNAAETNSDESRRPDR